MSLALPRSNKLRPVKMKQIDLTVLSKDFDNVVEFIGKSGVMQFTGSYNELSLTASVGAGNNIQTNQVKTELDSLIDAATYISIPLPLEPNEDSKLPGEAEKALAKSIINEVMSLNQDESKKTQEKQKIEETLNEARAFSSLKASFSDLDKLSYLTFRVGRLDPRYHDQIKLNLSDRAVIIPLGEDNSRIMAAASRKGRFALDTELKRFDFSPIVIPEGFKGIPEELLSGLEDSLKIKEEELREINNRKVRFKEQYSQSLESLIASYLLANTIEELKTRFTSTNSAYLVSGWIPEGIVKSFIEELENITENRIAVRSYNPDEIESIKEGTEKVPVFLSHGKFVNGFEGVVFSYGAPLYGTIDPTPFVAVFFTVLFGIMFGDLGQGLVLFLLGILTAKSNKGFFSKFKKFSTPLVAVGISSMIMGLLSGSVFTNEQLLVAPTRAVTAYLTGRPVDRILAILPLHESGGSVTRLFYFFGFTISVGVILNSIGLVINIINLFSRKKIGEALFSKTGLAGTLFFWYALSIAIRFLVSMLNPQMPSFVFGFYDVCGLLIPVAGIFFGHEILKLLKKQKPVFDEGFMVFIMKGIVEILETISTYVSNTVSFLRVGAFALSHAVLSFIVFFFAERVSGVVAGTALAILIFIIGNLIIILLEGLIVAIQVVRLQYYEFFNKFFVETGVEFAPFKFKAKN